MLGGFQADQDNYALLGYARTEEEFVCRSLLVGVSLSAERMIRMFESSVIISMNLDTCYPKIRLMIQVLLQQKDDLYIL